MRQGRASEEVARLQITRMMDEQLAQNQTVDALRRQVESSKTSAQQAQALLLAPIRVMQNICVLCLAGMIWIHQDRSHQDKSSRRWVPPHGGRVVSILILTLDGRTDPDKVSRPFQAVELFRLAK